MVGNKSAKGQAVVEMELALNVPLSKSDECQTLKGAWIETPLGPMLAVGDEQALYLLEFAQRPGLEKEMKRLQQKTKLPIVLGKTPPIQQIEEELADYFSGALKTFKTPFVVMGSPFQERVWEELQKIPQGETRSYLQVAKAIGRPTAFRAVALSNGANQLAIIIPCHRVINSNGAIGGYGGGVQRKQWLLEHEKNQKLSRS